MFEVKGAGDGFEARAVYAAGTVAATNPVGGYGCISERFGGGERCRGFVAIGVGIRIGYSTSSRSRQTATVEKKGGNMISMNRLMLIVLLTVGMLPIASPAQAYLDPGSGSMIVQVILGGVAGLVVAGKFYWLRIKESLGFASSEAPASERSADTDSD